MSPDGPTSLLSSVWRGALVLLGTAVCVWIAASLIQQVWVVLVVVAAVAVVITSAVIVLRWWWRRRQW
ncbi:hypothetical protein [Curtobacterium ammoniigenes]|uniref:hypothetical protein n=1 Tax=Curtobacterium ammoniigenes TaxID=395387 RepID=UPI00083086BC|nr:hypothetical protein [Curtobacterium ammoniigenes]